MSLDNLNTIKEKIIHSDYSSIESLIEHSHNYSLEDFRNFLEEILEMWKNQRISIAAFNALLKFAYYYLEQNKIKFKFKNKIPIPICYFSSFLILGGLFLNSLLTTFGFDVKLFSQNNSKSNLVDFIEEKKPSIIIFTLSQFLHVEELKELMPYFKKKKMNIFIGGIPFEYNKELKLDFLGCFFPKDTDELVHLIENYIKRG